MSFPLPDWAVRCPLPDPPVPSELRLGPRLCALANAVPLGARLVDIGTDHARLPEALVRAGRVRRAIASDVASAALEAARGRLRWPVDLRLGPGFEPVRPGEADTAVLAGFGGPKAQTILEPANLEALGIRRLILQPTAGLPGLRAWLAERGWPTVHESIVREGRRGFVTCVAEPGARPRQLTSWEALVGRADLRHPLLRAWLESQREHLLRQGPRGEALLRSVDAFLLAEALPRAASRREAAFAPLEPPG